MYNTSGLKDRCIMRIYSLLTLKGEQNTNKYGIYDIPHLSN